MKQKNIFDIKNYKFYSDLNNFKNFLLIVIKLILKIFKTENKHVQKNKIKKINIYINDWLTSSLFPFNLYLGILLNKDYKVVFLFDKFNLYNSLYSFLINYLCEIILKIVRKKFGINFITLGKFNEKKSKVSIKKRDINKMYNFNMIRYGRDVSFKLIKDKNYFKKINQAVNIYLHLESLIKSKIISKSDINFISGGYLNSSYFLNKLLRKNKINFYSYDSGKYKNGHSIYYCKNGIAGKMEESGIAYKNLKLKNYFNNHRMKKIKKVVLKEIINRRKNKSAIKYHQNSNGKVNTKNVDTKNFAMITINSGWDANSLDTDNVFPNYLTFLKKTTEFFKNKLPYFNLIIKNHPHRLTGYIKKDSVEKFSKRISSKNVKFLDSEETNFYEIINQCKLLISVSSTTISESLILGIPALSAGKDQYYHFNLGINCKNEIEFFKRIKDILLKKKKQRVDQNKKYIIYYFNHIKKYLHTDFNPQNFNWSKYNIDELRNTNHFKLVKKMIKKNNTYLETKLI